MKTILLAGGQSSRLKPISDKNLLTFCGKTLIEHQVHQLNTCGIEDIILVGNKHNLHELQNLPLTVTVVEQTDLTGGMKAAITACEDLIKNDSLLIVNSNDMIENEAIASFLQTVRTENIHGLILAKTVENYFPGGYLEVNAQNTIKSIIEKPGEGNEPSNLVNLVFHYHESANLLLQALESAHSEHDDLYEVALDNLFSTQTYKAFHYSGDWFTIKYPWHILDMTTRFLAKTSSYISPEASVSEHATIHGNVYIEDGAKICDHASIVGPAYIGKNTIVANNCLVRQSIIEKNSVVGFSTEIARSYVGKNVSTHQSYIGDSVIEGNTNFAAGCITGNWRFDGHTIAMNIKKQKILSPFTKLGAVVGKNVKFGVNTCIMPGIKIGKNCFIGANCNIDTDISDNSYVKNKNTLEIRDKR